MRFDHMRELAEARSKVYGFFVSTFCRPPDQKLVEMLVSGRFYEQLKSILHAADCPENLKEGIKLLKAFALAHTDGSRETLTLDLAAEWTRLFRGLKPCYSPLPPYESIYVGEGFMGPSTLKVIKKYSDVGLAMSEECKEPPDYIGVELAFMHCLASKEAKAWSVGDVKRASELLSKEKSFLEEHVTRWVPRFCDEVMERDRTVLYRALAKIVKAFIALDLELLKELCRM